MYIDHGFIQVMKQADIQLPSDSTVVGGVAENVFSKPV